MGNNASHDNLYHKSYYKKNRIKILKQRVIRYWKNRKKCIKQVREWQGKNADKFKKSQRKWYQANKELIKIRRIRAAKDCQCHIIKNTIKKTRKK